MIYEKHRILHRCLRATALQLNTKQTDDEKHRYRRRHKRRVGGVAWRGANAGKANVLPIRSAVNMGRRGPRQQEIIFYFYFRIS